MQVEIRQRIGKAKLNFHASSGYFFNGMVHRREKLF